MAKSGNVKKPGAPRGAGLTRERIGAAALELVDAEGLDALTARRLAALLGCEAMSLYHHVAGMDGVLDEIVDRVLGELVLPREGAADWRRAARALARQYLRVARAHPRAMALVAGRRWRTPAAIGVARAAVALFANAGFAPRSAVRAARILGGYLNGAALATAGWLLAADDPDAPHLPGGGGERGVRADLEAGVDLLIHSLEQLAPVER